MMYNLYTENKYKVTLTIKIAIVTAVCIPDMVNTIFKRYILQFLVACFDDVTGGV